MATIETPNIFASFLQGQQAGQEQRKQRTIANFLQPAMSGDQAALSQIYGASPELGMQLQDRATKQVSADRERILGDLQQAARLYPSAPDEIKTHLYAKIVDGVEGLGLAPTGSLPRQHDPALDANFNKFLAGISGETEPSLSDRYRVVGGALVDLTNPTQPVYTAPEKQEFQLSPDGTQWLPKPTGRQQAGDLGPTIADPGAQGFDSLYASVPGLRVTSGMRTPEQNKAAGGVANSFHLTGQAIDIGTPNPEQRAGINQWAAQNGYEVIDNYKDGHVHLEPRGRPAQAPSNGGAIPIPGARPRESEETFSQPQVVTNPQTGKQELVQFGNRGGRRVVNDYTPGPTDRDAKPPTEGERKAATLLSRLEFSEKQLRDAVNESKGAASPSLLAEGVRRIPLFGGDTSANAVTSAARQRVEAAQLDILDAALTLGTGAAYTREQLEGYRRSYFPQLGDSQATIDDKAARLQNIIDSARIAAGRAVKPGGSEPSGGASSGGWSIRVKP